MDGENNGKPYEQMDDLGGKNPYFWFNTQMHQPPELSKNFRGGVVEPGRGGVEELEVRP